MPQYLSACSSYHIFSGCISSTRRRGNVGHVVRVTESVYGCISFRVVQFIPSLVRLNQKWYVMSHLRLTHITIDRFTR